MNRLLLLFLVLSLVFLPALSQAPRGPSGATPVSFAISVNSGYGNYLYLDNIAVGTRQADDAAIAAIQGIPQGTVYSVGSGSVTVNPKVVVLVAGKNRLASATVSLQMAEIGYSQTQTLYPLNSGVSQIVVFPSATIPPGQAVNTVASLSGAADDNHSNDTLRIQTMIMQGVQRTAFFEEATNAS